MGRAICSLLITAIVLGGCDRKPAPSAAPGAFTSCNTPADRLCSEYTALDLAALGDLPHKSCHGAWTETHCPTQELLGSCKGLHGIDYYYKDLQEPLMDALWLDAEIDCRSNATTTWIPTSGQHGAPALDARATRSCDSRLSHMCSEYTGAALQELGDEPQRTCAGDWSDRPCPTQDLLGTCKGPYRTKMFYVIPNEPRDAWKQQETACIALSKNTWISAR